MDGRTMRTLVEHIAELHSSGGHSNRAIKQSGFDTTLNNDVDGEQGNQDGNERYCEDDSR